MTASSYFTLFKAISVLFERDYHSDICAVKIKLLNVKYGSIIRCLFRFKCPYFCSVVQNVLVSNVSEVLTQYMNVQCVTKILVTCFSYFFLIIDAHEVHFL